jgi:hypothetical protein
MVLKNTDPDEIAVKTSEMNQMKEWYKKSNHDNSFNINGNFSIRIVGLLFAALVLET